MKLKIVSRVDGLIRPDSTCRRNLIMGISEQHIFYGVATQLSPITPKYDSNSNTILEFPRAMLRKIHLP
jgi:hypothetical protein